LKIFKKKEGANPYYGVYNNIEAFKLKNPLEKIFSKNNFEAKGYNEYFSF